MKKLFSVCAISSIISLAPTIAMAQTEIRAQDNTFLGDINSDRYDPNSICNRFGVYGSQFGDGIWSTYGAYGMRSVDSAYDRNNRKPPRLIDQRTRRTVGRLSKNTTLRNSIDPDLLRMEVCGE